MTTPLSAQLFVPEFVATGQAGEYTFEDATFVNQADTAGNGAYDVVVNQVLYVPATDSFTAMVIPGVMHRYRLSAVTIVDADTVNGTAIWDESGEEENIPTNGSFCLISEVTPVNKLGLFPSDSLYANMVPGSTDGAMRSEIKNRLDSLTGGGSGSLPFVKYEFNEAIDWVVVHGRNTKSFAAVTRDSAGERFYAAEHVIDNNSFVIHCTEVTSGSVDVFFSQ